MSSTSTNDNDNNIINSSSTSTTEEWWSSWNAAHARTCRSRCALFATPNQVLDYTKSHTATTTNINTNSLIYWSLPNRKEVFLWTFNNNADTRAATVESFLQKYKPLETASSATESPTAPLSTAAASVPTTATRSRSSIGGGIFSTIWSAFSFSRPTGSSAHLDDDDDDEEEEEDDALRSWDEEEEEEEEDAGLTVNTAITTTTTVNKVHQGPMTWNSPVLQVDFAEACLNVLQKALSSQETTTTNPFPTMVPLRQRQRRQRNAADNTTCTTRDCSSWKEWVQSTAAATVTRDDHQCNSNANIADINTNKILSQLSDVELDFLLECLTRLGSVTIIPGSSSSNDSGTFKTDLVVLAPPDAIICTTENGTSTSYQVMAAWYELVAAQASLESNRQHWSTEAEKYAQRALREKAQARNTTQNRNSSKAGLVSFKIHKLFMKRLEDSEGVELNLERSRQALEESWHQRQVVAALKTSTQALKELRRNSPLDEMDALMESYREEVEHVQNYHQALASVGQQQHYDEEDLLRELQGITLEDDDYTTSNNNNKNTGSKADVVTTTTEVATGTVAISSVAGLKPPVTLPSVPDANLPAPGPPIDDEAVAVEKKKLLVSG